MEDLWHRARTDVDLSYLAQAAPSSPLLPHVNKRWASGRYQHGHNLGTYPTFCNTSVARSCQRRQANQGRKFSSRGSCFMNLCLPQIWLDLLSILPGLIQAPLSEKCNLNTWQSRTTWIRVCMYYVRLANTMQTANWIACHLLRSQIKRKPPTFAKKKAKLNDINGWHWIADRETNR